MTNLVPPDHKKALKKEYIVRMASVWSLLFAAALAAAFALTIPVYVLVNGQLEAVNIENLSTNQSEQDYALIEAEITRANRVSAQLNLQSGTILSSRIMTEIDSVTPSGVLVTTYHVEVDETDRKVHVQGVADTREVLAAFKTALERSAMFDAAKIPISDLARNEELPFIVEITMAQ